ncbi:MAG: SAM-dependent methyltransferase [Cellvibrionaceae bacterium]|nr:SAM-dependent methyltransferase [Cellvibrionaceae bacterium]
MKREGVSAQRISAAKVATTSVATTSVAKTPVAKTPLRESGHVSLELSDREFQMFQDWLHRAAGIKLTATKKSMVAARLGKRLRFHGLTRYGDYFRMIMEPAATAELQVALDLLTTNETYFFREPKHFEFLQKTVLPQRIPGRPFRVWSAASSSGEEAYSIAMLLADQLSSTQWEIFASDISTHVLRMASNAHYPMERARHIPPQLLARYCLKGMGPQEGTLLVNRALRSKVTFAQINLNQTLPEIGEFDVIFLRNVLIYFDQETKRKVVTRVTARLKPGGYFLIGHSESLHGVTDALRLVSPSIYCKK